VIKGLFIILCVAIFISPFASSFPDGLEKVARDKNFIKMEKDSILNAPIPDYVWPSISNQMIAISLAAGIGAIVVLLTTIGICYIFKRK
jgi:cobalt/nickel transport protein